VPAELRSEAERDRQTETKAPRSAITENAIAVRQSRVAGTPLCRARVVLINHPERARAHSDLECGTLRRAP
jgi:hypothetical protein